MSQIPPPPVPQTLRDMLKDYPEHIERLQDVLTSYIQKPARLMPFDGAIWALESRLETFISEARSELETAESGGDPVEIERAKAKKMVMLRASSSNGGLLNLSTLRAYFIEHEEAFK